MFAVDVHFSFFIIESGLESIVLIHSYLRWVVLFFILLVLISSLLGWVRCYRRVSRQDEQKTFWMTLSFDLMTFVGLVLWIFGNKGYELIKTFGMSTVMKESAMRFNVIEHPLTMLIALILLHIGKSKLGKQHSSKKKDGRGYRILFFYTLVAFILVIISIPWPWREGIGRPLFPS